MYIMSSAVISREPNFAEILAENNDLRTAPTETKYFITNEIEQYLNGDTKTDAEFDPDDLEKLAKKINEAPVNDGQSLFQNSNYSPYNKVHSVAHLNPEANSCNNLVLEVRYEIFWSATEIVKVGPTNM